MIRPFDYAFYSFYKLYLETEKEEPTNIDSAMYAISILKLSFILGVGILTSVFYKGKLSENLGLSKDVFTIILVISLFLYAAIDKKSYKKRLPEIIKKYKNDPRNKWFKPWMLIFVGLGFIFISILIVKSIQGSL